MPFSSPLISVFGIGGPRDARVARRIALLGVVVDSKRAPAVPVFRRADLGAPGRKAAISATSRMWAPA